MPNPAPAKQRWYRQLAETYSFAKQHISKLPLKLAGIFLGTFAVIFGIGVLTDLQVTLGLLGFSTALLVTLFWFGRAAEKAAYRSIEDQPGAAAAVLGSMRGAWQTTPGVGVDKQQNLVHRVVGRPGIILIGEGPRPGGLLAEQRKAHARYAPNIPIHEIVVGPGQVTLNGLQAAVRKLPKSLAPREVTELRRRLDAMPKTALPIPKGPMPTRIPRR